jgi:hypothetical protein
VKPVARATPTPDAVAMQVCAALLKTDLNDVAAAKALGEKAAKSGDTKIRLDVRYLAASARIAAMDKGTDRQASSDIDFEFAKTNLRVHCIVWQNGGGGIP